MMNYTIDSRNPYPAQAYMIVADDDVREWGTQNWEEKSAEYQEKGFIPVSMKNDFAQIYEEGITRSEVQYQEYQEEKEPEEKQEHLEEQEPEEKQEHQEDGQESEEEELNAA